jgi:hypothetical protein
MLGSNCIQEGQPGSAVSVRAEAVNSRAEAHHESLMSELRSFATNWVGKPIVDARDKRLKNEKDSNLRNVVAKYPFER